MEHVEFHHEVRLNEPTLIAAFKGWNDAGASATSAAEHLTQAWNAKRIASIDPEEFYDFQATRPNVVLDEGMTRHITWPANEFWAAKDQHGHDVLVLNGVEPNLRWRLFSNIVVEIAQRYDVSFVITLGALLADVPHSRPVPITGTAADPELIARLGLQRSRYEGPTGIVGVLHDAFAKQGIGSASLWAAVPHYLAVSPNPKAALALVEKTVALTEIPADIGELYAATEHYEERVAEVVAADEDIANYVHMLEQRLDEGETAFDQEVPSGESIAAELERFLREHGD